MLRAAVHWSNSTTCVVHIYVDAIEPSTVKLLSGLLDAKLSLAQELTKQTLDVLGPIFGAGCKRWLKRGTIVNFIKSTAIYDDDTRAILRAKLFAHIKHTVAGPQHIYTWAYVRPNIDEHVSHCFASGTAYVSKETLANILDTTFEDNTSINSISNALDPEETLEFLNKHYGHMLIPEALEVERVDESGHHIPMHAQPFQPTLILEGTVTNTGDYLPDSIRGRQVRMSNSQRLVGNIQVVHYTTSADLERVAMLEEKNRIRCFIGFIKRYCPLIHNITDLDVTVSAKIMKTLQGALHDTDEVVHSLRAVKEAPTSEVSNLTFRRVNLIINPTPEAKWAIHGIDIELLFRSLHPEPFRPFYELRDYDNQLFKINQHSLGKNVSFENLRDWMHCSKFNKLSDMSARASRSKRTLCAWLALEGAPQQFCRVVIFEDGGYQLSIKNNSSIRAFSTVNSFMHHICSALALPRSTFYELHSENFQITPPFFAEYVEHDAEYLLSTQQQLIETAAHIKDWLIKFMYPYAYVIFSDKNVVLFKYKRVDDYIDAKDVYEMAITLKAEGVPHDIIIEQLCKMFNISEEVAIAKAEAPPAKTSNLQNAFKSRYNNGVLIKLTINTKYQVRVECKGIRNPAFFGRVQQFIHAACLANKEGLVKFDAKTNVTLQNITNVNEIVEEQNAEKPVKATEDVEDEEEEEDEDFLGLVDFRGGSTKATADEKEVHRYRDQIKKALYDMDKDLFGYTKPKANYSLKCQTSDMRMPIGLTTAEKDVIDERYRNSYTTSVTAGSSEENCKQNHYICPHIWCPISRVAVTDKDLVDGFCPVTTPGAVPDEKPIYLESSYWNAKNKGADRYPGYLGKHIHPQGFSLPCCFKTKSKDLRPVCKPITEQPGNISIPVSAAASVNSDVEEVQEAEAAVETKAVTKAPTKAAEETEAAEIPADVYNLRYIHKKANVPLEPNQYGVTPRALASYLDSLNCNAKEGSKCFVRRGAIQGPNSFIACMSHLLNISNPEALLELIVTNMSHGDYITLNGGNTLKLFVDPKFQITNVDHYNQFRNWLCADPAPEPTKRYIVTYGLKDVVEIVRTKPYQISSAHVNVRREFIIYNSFQNFLSFLNTPTLLKHHDILYDLMSPRFKWLNPQHRQLILFECDDADNVTLYCPKYVSVGQSIDLTQTFVLVLKQKNTYESVVRVLFERTGLREIAAFPYTGSGAAPIKKAIDYLRKGCRSIIDDAVVEAREVRAILESLGYIIKKYVLTAGFKLCGYIVQSSIYVPLELRCPFTLIPRTGVKVCFVSTLGSLKPDALKARQLFKNLNDRKIKRLNRISIYGNPEDIIEDDVLVGLRVHNYIVPINMSEGPILQSSISELTLDDIIFINGATNGADVNESMRKSPTYRYGILLTTVVRTILTVKKLARNMHIIKHALNPLSVELKRAGVANVVRDALVHMADAGLLNGRAGATTAEERELLEEDIYQKDLRFILRQHHDDTPRPEEISMDQYDVIRDPNLEKLEASVQNPFKHINNSIEDYIEEVRAPAADSGTGTGSGADIDTHIEGPEWNMWSYSKTANADSVTITPVRTRTTLCGKSKPWVMHSKILLKNALCDLIMIASDLKGTAIDHDTMEEYIYNVIMEDHENNLESLIKELSINDSFSKENKTHSLELTADEILDIRNKPNYRYGLYELRNLMAYIGVNLVIVGRKQEKLVEGYLYFNNSSHSTMIFFMSPKGEFHLIFDPVQKRFLFNGNDFSEMSKPGAVIRIIPQNHV